MKAVNLTSQIISAAELLDMARKDSLLVRTQEGDSFVVSQADEFATEVELLRQNHTFLAMLDEFKNEKETIPLEQVETELR
jgi:hypothetical protein